MTIGNIFGLNTLSLLTCSAIFNIAFCMAFIMAAESDRRIHEVTGVNCLIIGTLLLVHAVMLGGSPFAIIMICICLAMTFGPLEIAAFGQADFLMLAHFITGYTWTSTGMSLMLIAGIVWLTCLCVHLCIYKDKYGNKWKPFKGVMIPAIPSYTVSIVVVEVLRFLLTKPLFYAGF